MDDSNESGSNDKVGWIITIIVLVGIIAAFFIFKGGPNVIDQQRKRTLQRKVRSQAELLNRYDKQLVNKVLQYNVNKIPKQLSNDPKYKSIIEIYKKQTQNAHKQSQRIKRDYVY